MTKPRAKSLLSRHRLKNLVNVIPTRNVYNNDRANLQDTSLRLSVKLVFDIIKNTIRLYNRALRRIKSVSSPYVNS